jgi:hypothetical protein
MVKWVYVKKRGSAKKQKRSGGKKGPVQKENEEIA